MFPCVGRGSDFLKRFPKGKIIMELVDTSTGEVVIDNESGRMVSAEVQAGREAWTRIKESGKKLRSDWLKLAAALDFGRQLCTPEGKGLNKKSFGQWCDIEGFGDVEVSQRSNCLWLHDNKSILGDSQITANNPTDIRKIARKIERAENIGKQIEDIEAGIDLPAGVYEVISIDPPWPYRDGKEATDYDPSGRRAANPYPEMSLDDIGDIELPAADDCVLWLWTTHKFMRHSFDLLDNWGFQDKAILTWVKDRMGLGAWLRSQSEFCIMAVKGKPIIQLTNQTTVLNGKMREHSRKPDEFYEMVNGLCVGRKLDYFSRESREGWEQLGNDQEKFNAVGG